MSWRTYYYLTKPGIIYGNSINATAGFLLAAVNARHFDFGLLLATLTGTALVIACGCVWNNVMDRDIDRKMARTKHRALVTGDVAPRIALLYGATLGVLGFGVLMLYTNILVMAAGAVGLIDYIVLYGYFKRRSVYGTLVGSVAGATPPLAGYVAVTGRLDMGALLVFLLLVLWQMPHFYAIAMYRLQDYTAAGIPVWPARRGLRATKVQTSGYIVAFTAAAVLLSVYGYTGYSFAVIMALVGVVWLELARRGFHATDDTKWARQMFSFSLIVTLIMVVMLPAGALLP